MKTFPKLSCRRQAFQVSIGVLLATCSFGLIGCGGGAGNSGADTGGGVTGRTATVSIDWKNSPAGVKSVKVDITNAGVVASTKTQDRPATNGVTTLTFDNLPVSSLNAVTSEFDAVGGTGNSLGAVAGSLGTALSSSITLQSGGAISTIGTLVSISIVAPGQAKQLALTLKDSAGNQLLTPPGQIKWSSSNPLIATVDQSGRVTGVSEGSIQIMATDTVSGKATGFGLISSVSSSSGSGNLVGTWKIKSITFNGVSTDCPGSIILPGIADPIVCPEGIIKINADGTYDSTSKEPDGWNRSVGTWSYVGEIPTSTETKHGTDDNHDGVVSDSELMPVTPSPDSLPDTTFTAGGISTTTHFQFNAIGDHFVIQITVVQSFQGTVRTTVSTYVYQRQ